MPSKTYWAVGTSKHIKSGKIYQQKLKLVFSDRKGNGKLTGEKEYAGVGIAKISGKFKEIKSQKGFEIEWTQDKVISGKSLKPASGLKYKCTITDTTEGGLIGTGDKIKGHCYVSGYKSYELEFTLQNY